MEEQTQQTEQSQQPSIQPVQAPTGEDKDVKDNKLWALLGYLGILCLIPLLAKKDSKFAQFHAKQGTVLFVSWFVASYVAGVVPFVGHALVLPAVSIFGIVLTIMGLINVANGAKKELPVIGDLAKKIKL